MTSFKSEHGTAFLTTVDFANVADWDAVLTFIRDTEAYDMLEKRVSKTAVRGYIEANKAVPPRCELRHQAGGEHSQTRCQGVTT